MNCLEAYCGILAKRLADALSSQSELGFIVEDVITEASDAKTRAVKGLVLWRGCPTAALKLGNDQRDKG